LGGLLDSPDLPATWPIRVILNKSEKTNPSPEFVWKSGPLFGQIGFVWKSDEPLPLEVIAGILLDDNTPRLPADAESGLRQLLGSIRAHGSHVTWGGPVAHPDLAWARMQLFATRFEYSASFHIFVTSLRNGSSIRVAERNAFNRDPDVLEREAAANLQSGHWEGVPVSGRPLDPKRDFGEHIIPDALLNVFKAAAQINDDPKGAEQAFKAAIEAGDPAKPFGFEGIAALAQREKRSPLPDLEDAIQAGSKSAPVYLMAADSLPRLKTAASMNRRWAEPIHGQAQLATNPLEKEALLKKAVDLAPRRTDLWIELAETQISDGHVELANGSWLRAEDSAATPDERNRVHELRMSKEQDRLEAAEAKNHADRDQARQADQRAQDDEMARIHAAEQKANQAVAAEAGDAKPDQVVPWQETVPKKTLVGTLVKVDCLDSSDRLSVKDRSGRVLTLTLADPSQVKLTCGPQKPQPRVSLTYTDDRIVTLELK
jgi:hypothetical protein